jgi:alpha-ribazole phosphatase
MPVDLIDRKCTIYLMRHGDTRRDTVRRYTGWDDIPLIDHGRRQAAWWRERLADIPFSRIISSDLCRAVETAYIISEGRGLPVEQCVFLREINLGVWDGLAMDYVRQVFPDEFARRGVDCVAYRPEGGESFADLQQRVVKAFNGIVESEPNGTLLIVAHAGVNRALLCHLLGVPLENLFRIGQEYACLNRIVIAVDSIKVQCVNVVPHLW